MLDVGVFLDRKTGTGFVGELAMPVDCGIGIYCAELHEEFTQRFLLGIGARVHRLLPVLGQTAHIADADAVGIIACGVCAYHVNVASLVDAAVKVYHEVVADVFPTAVYDMVTADGFNRDVLAFLCRGAVEDYLVNLPLGSLQVQHSQWCLIVVIVRWLAFSGLDALPASGCRQSGS